MPSARVIGIDLGSHKTLVARWDETRNQPVLARLRPGQGDDMPTTVHAGLDGRMSFGDEAEEKGGGDFVGSRQSFKHDLAKAPFPCFLHDREFTVLDLARDYLRWLKELVEAESLHGPVERAVVAVPAAWSPAARKQFSSMLEQVPLPGVELLEEPVAAAMALLRGQPELWPRGPVLVFDWGAGALQMAVLKAHSGRLQVAPGLIVTEEHLGGESIDLHLLQMINRRLIQLGQPGLDHRSGREKEQARRMVRDWKLRFFRRPDGEWKASCLDGVGTGSDVTWTSRQIQDVVETRINEALEACAQLVEKARAAGQPPAAILLLGGSSQFPVLLEKLKARLPDTPALKWDQRMSAVALGAAWQASGMAPAVNQSSGSRGWYDPQRTILGGR